MIMKTIELNVPYEKMDIVPPTKKAELTCYLLDKEPRNSTMMKKRPAVVVCPGGAYYFVSPPEGEPIALKYAAAGFHVFVLNYSVDPTGWPAQAVEASMAVSYVRSIADEYGIDKEKVFICGFSAGGHLAASLCLYWNHPLIRELSGAKDRENRPDGMILGYPVISGEDAITHKDTRRTFVGGRSENQLLFSLEKNVHPDVPPAFIWHTYTDAAVPVQNSLRFADALLTNNVNCELHIYPEGRHGLSLSNYIVAGDEEGKISAVENWMDMSIRWILEQK